MKLTDFALIFVAIFLPIVIIVYINTSFVVKAEKQEMYYKNIMNSAVSDAVSAMKRIENSDSQIDYGYSGLVDKKVSINEKIAISSFYNSLANNFNVNNNEMSLERLKMYIPVIAIFDYDGIYIHSAEQDELKNISFVTKPKVYYTYSYVITKDSNLLSGGNTEYNIVALEDVKSINEINLLEKQIYEVTFTMDDYIYLNIYNIDSKKGTASELEKSIAFYLSDSTNNVNLVYSNNITTANKANLVQQIVKHLTGKRLDTIGAITMKEISYAINKHNDYARLTGIGYNFKFSIESDEEWYETIDGIGMMAVIQGISFGNRYLNYKAYSASDLIAAKRYYLSMGITDKENDLAYYTKNLYHNSNLCKVYIDYLNNTNDKLVPSYYLKKSEAATHGFYPCPICKP